MDLTVSTKQYVFSASSGFDYIVIYLMNNMKKHPKSCGIDEYWYLTKKEVKALIEYLKENVPSEQAKRYERLLDSLNSMEMLMEGKQKAEFHVW